MIIYKSHVPLRLQIKKNIQELNDYKDLYNQKILEYSQSVDYINKLLEKEQCKQMTNTLAQNSKEKIKIFNIQLSKIDRNLETLNNLKENLNTLDKNNLLKIINRYNRKYKDIKNNLLINNFSLETDKLVNHMQELPNTNLRVKNENLSKEEVKNMNENIKENMSENNFEDTINSTTNIINEIENNDTLLISEVLNKVLLPYTAKEVIEILQDENNNYKTAQDVIDNVFTRPFSDYKFQFYARYNETIKLAHGRLGFKLTDSIQLALEMMTRRYLHPAIISACRTLDELDVYLDCLDKNEVDDFKIFKIKYELHPILAKQDKNNKFKILSTKKSSNNKKKLIIKESIL